jgi:glycosyltransferase involved in cell wall biosynthesis
VAADGGDVVNVALLCITDGRWDYLDQTLRSVEQMFKDDWTQALLVNDSGSQVPGMLALAGQTIVNNPERKGLAGAIQTGWDNLADDIDYVFHLEDDFTFPDPVDVAEMVALLEANDDLAQVALLRQPWSPEEQQAGGIFQANPSRFLQADGYVAQSNLFTFNPCVYPRWVTFGPAGIEQKVTDDLLAAGCHFGYLGQLDDPPRCVHIGARRSAGHKW